MKEQEQQPPGQTGLMDPVPDHGEQSYVGHGRLEGKKAVITGGDSGIGRAVAIAFAREGADVLISYLEERDDAADTARLVEAAGQQAVTVAGDIADPAHCRQVIAAGRQTRSSESMCWSTTPRFNEPTKRSRTSPTTSGTCTSRQTSPRCFISARRRCHTCGKARRSSTPHR